MIGKRFPDKKESVLQDFIEISYEIKKPLLRAVSFEKRGLKNIYEKLCLKYTKILDAFNI